MLVTGKNRENSDYKTIGGSYRALGFVIFATGIATVTQALGTKEFSNSVGAMAAAIGISTASIRIITYVINRKTDRRELSFLKRSISTAYTDAIQARNICPKSGEYER